jgi:hypothetical protein
MAQHLCSPVAAVTVPCHRVSDDETDDSSSTSGSTSTSTGTSTSSDEPDESDDTLDLRIGLHQYYPATTTSY